MYTSLMVLLFVFASANGGVHEDCDISPISNCPFYNFQSDKVTPQQMLDQNVMGEHWLLIYYSEFDAHQAWGKCNFRWNRPGQDGIVHREEMCYNFDTETCEDYVRNVTRKEDSCGRVEENAVSGTMDGKFYSQDLSQYFWYDPCYNYTQSEDCELRYIDLLVRVSRYPDDENQELDLQGLPWHLISADLKINFGMEISNNLMKFSWKGPECGFDGKLKTTSGVEEQRARFIGILCVVAISLLF